MARAAALTLLIVLTAACSDSGSSDEPSTPAGTEEAEHAEDFTFGKPAEPGAEDRVIEVTQSDDMRYDPTSIEVASGETIRFEVTNAGQATHEFVLGDTALQAEHEAEMAEMAEMGQTAMTAVEPNMVSVEPGETATLVWTFTDTGVLEYACHVAGHYPAGMKGDLTIS
jgi:uncharacterized cupredoxin-like copper-binding protein